MPKLIESLLMLEPEIRAGFAEARPDYRGNPITPSQVLRYLYTDLYRIQEITELVARHSTPTDSILDIGPGYGFYDLLLARHHGRNIAGLELETNIPIYCGLIEKAGITIIPGALTEQGLPVNDGAYDFIILSEVFEHLRIGPLTALEGIWRALRPGGKLLLSTPNIARLANVAYLLTGKNVIEPLPGHKGELQHVTDTWQHIREYTMKELKVLLRRAGFEIVEARFSHCWDRYNPQMMQHARLLHRGAQVVLSLVTGFIPSLRADLMVLAVKPEQGERLTVQALTRDQSVETPGISPIDRSEPLSLVEILNLAGPGWLIKLGGRRILREWRRRTAPSSPRKLAPRMAQRVPRPSKFFVEPDTLTARTKLVEDVIPEARELTFDTAGDVLNHRVDLLGSGPVEFGEVIDWHIDFKTGYRWPLLHHLHIKHPPLASPHDVKVPWELNRTQHFVTLAKAYRFSGDARYAEAFVDQARHWLASNPLEFGVAWAGPMDAAIRAVNWIWAFHLLQDSPVVQGFRAEFEQSMFEHGWYLLRNQEDWFPPTNHLIADQVGLVYLGVMFPQFTEARRWLRQGVRGLVREIRRQVNPDGFTDESATSYQGLVTEFFLSAFALCQINDVPISRTAWRQLERMVEVILAYIRPDGLDPQIGDADDGRLHVLGAYPDPASRARDQRHLLAIASVLFDRPDFAAAAGDRWEDALWMFGARALPYFESARGASRSENSACFSQGGLAVMRTPAHYLSAFAGSIGHRNTGGHGHNDALSITLFALDTPFLIDPGTFVYSADIHMRNYFRATLSHNTVQVDRQEINRFVGSDIFRLHADARPAILHWDSTEKRDLLEAAHYGYERLQGRVIHRRQIVFDKEGGFWFMRDVLLGTGIHTLEWFFHFGVQEIEPEPEGALTASGPHDAHLLIVPTGGIIPTIFSGWYAPRYGVRYSAPVGRYTYRDARLPLQMDFLLYPYRHKLSRDQVESAIERGTMLLEQFPAPLRRSPADATIEG